MGQRDGEVNSGLFEREQESRSLTGAVSSQAPIEGAVGAIADVLPTSSRY